MKKVVFMGTKNRKFILKLNKLFLYRPSGFYFPYGYLCFIIGDCFGGKFIFITWQFVWNETFFVAYYSLQSLFLSSIYEFSVGTLDIQMMVSNNKVPFPNGTLVQLRTTLVEQSITNRQDNHYWNYLQIEKMTQIN